MMCSNLIVFLPDYHLTVLLLTLNKCHLIWEFTLNHFRAFTQSLKVICLSVCLKNSWRGVFRIQFKTHFLNEKQTCWFMGRAFSMLFFHDTIGCSLFWYPLVTWIFSTPRFNILGPVLSYERWWAQERISDTEQSWWRIGCISCIEDRYSVSLKYWNIETF